MTSLSFTLPTTNDTLFEGNEAFSVSIADPGSGRSPTAASAHRRQRRGGIAWSIVGGGNVAEGAAASFTVSYTGATLAEGNTVSINLAFAAGATEAADFGDAFLTDVAQAIALLPSGHGISLAGSTLTFSNPAVTSLSFTLPTTNDTLFEGNEAFSVSIADPSSGSVAAQTASATIVDNDAGGTSPGRSVAAATSPKAPRRASRCRYGGRHAGRRQHRLHQPGIRRRCHRGGGFRRRLPAPTSRRRLRLLPGHGISRSGRHPHLLQPGGDLAQLHAAHHQRHPVRGQRGLLGVDRHAEPWFGVAAQTACGHRRQRRGGTSPGRSVGGGNVAEGAAASFTVSYGGATLAEGNTVSITWHSPPVRPRGRISATPSCTDVAEAIAAAALGHGISLAGRHPHLLQPGGDLAQVYAAHHQRHPVRGQQGLLGVDGRATLGTVVAPTANATIIDNDPTAGAPIILEVDEAALSTAVATGSNPSLTTEVDNSPTLSFTAAGSNWCRFDSQASFRVGNGSQRGRVPGIFWVLDPGTQLAAISTARPRCSPSG